MTDTAAPPRWTEYMPLAALKPAKRNPKEHDEPEIAASYARFGLIETQTLDERTGRLLSGHGRLKALQDAEAEGGEPPEGIVCGDDGVWLVPVSRGWRSRNDKEAEAALIAVNRLVESGGWSNELLAAMLDDISKSRAGLDGVGFDQYALDDLLADLQEGMAPNYGGVDDTNSVEDKAAGYANSGVRSVVLDYPVAKFDRVVRLAQELRRKLALDTNSDLFAHLVEEAAAANGIVLGDTPATA